MVKITLIEGFTDLLTGSPDRGKVKVSQGLVRGAG